jgi:hypothetical protein
MEAVHAYASFDMRLNASRFLVMPGVVLHRVSLPSDRSSISLSMQCNILPRLSKPDPIMSDWQLRA